VWCGVMCGVGFGMVFSVMRGMVRSVVCGMAWCMAWSVAWCVRHGVWCGLLKDLALLNRLFHLKETTPETGHILIWWKSIFWT
jgi:hypothetical protein